MDINQALPFLKPIMEAWQRRNDSTPVRKANLLTFWEDGMLQELRLIASGKASERTFTNLKGKFSASADGVEKTMKELRALRPKFGPTPIGRQIDKILHADSYGKGDVRFFIEMLIRSHDPQPYEVPKIAAEDLEREREEAKELCQRIEVLNAEISRLSRMLEK